MKKKQRCQWCLADPLYIDYHDKEWGVPVHDDQAMFEFLILEGMQAGLSWLTILKKRENFRKAFANFNPEKIARFNTKEIEKLMLNSGIIRNRLKISAVITNAQTYLDLVEVEHSFCDYLWQFAGGKTLKNSWKSLKQIPCETKESQAMSKDLKKRGFKFVGPTICYAHMQATGMMNDHLVSCFRYKEL